MRKECAQAVETTMLAERPACAGAVFDGGVDDPRTLLRQYQQSMRHQLLTNVMVEANRAPWWLATSLAVGRAIYGLLVPNKESVHAATRPPAAERSRPDLPERLMDVLTGCLVLQGTLMEVAAQFTADVGPLRETLRDLREAGRIAVRTLPGAQVQVYLERRGRLTQDSVSRSANRRVHANAWAF